MVKKFEFISVTNFNMGNPSLEIKSKIGNFFLLSFLR